MDPRIAKARLKLQLKNLVSRLKKNIKSADLIAENNDYLCYEVNVLVNDTNTLLASSNQDRVTLIVKNTNNKAITLALDSAIPYGKGIVVAANSTYEADPLYIGPISASTSGTPIAIEVRECIALGGVSSLNLPGYTAIRGISAQSNTPLETGSFILGGLSATGLQPPIAKTELGSGRFANSLSATSLAVSSTKLETGEYLQTFNGIGLPVESPTLLGNGFFNAYLNSISNDLIATSFAGEGSFIGTYVGIGNPNYALTEIGEGTYNSSAAFNSLEVIAETTLEAGSFTAIGLINDEAISLSALESGTYLSTIDLTGNEGFSSSFAEAGNFTISAGLLEEQLNTSFTTLESGSFLATFELTGADISSESLNGEGAPTATYQGSSLDTVAHTNLESGEISANLITTGNGPISMFVTESGSFTN